MDLNGDGNIDLLSESYSGLSFIFYGNKNSSFNEAIVLKDKSDTDINWGYSVKAHDWDNDGDLDLLMSGYEGVKLRINEGTKTKPVFGTKNIEVVPAHHADAMIDWDGDGLWDIVGGSKEGDVYFYKNIGKLESPSFGEVECLIKSTEFIDKTRGGICGITQITVADYNNDGKLDLIIGNNNSINKQLKPETAQKIKKKLLLKSKLESLLKESLNNNDDEAFEIMDKLKKVNNELRKFYIQIIPEKHGYVWISLRK